MWAFIGLLSVLMIIIGAINLIKPLHFMRIKSRRQALVAFGMGFIVFIVAVTNTPNITTAPTSTTETAKNSSPTKLSIEEYLAQTINKVIGSKSNRNNLPRIRKIWSENNQWFAQLNADDNLTTKMIRGGILSESKNVFKRTFEERSDITGLTLQWVFPLQDLKGNSQDVLVATITMSKANAATINWDNVLYDNLPLIADKYIDHPALRK